ncbi:MAG TPA: ABC transporter substrate-binding protein [Acidimicrobiales bacterium]|nr:ABC transporter substrate-binding protein [Acidimicrobiales bacterium]
MRKVLRPAKIAAALVVGALVAAACGTASTSTTTTAAPGSTTQSQTNQASAPGITPTQILLGSTQPLSGPAAPGYEEIAPASNAVFQWVNAHGGVFGRKIKYDFLNDEYDPALTVTLTKQLLSMPVFADFDPLGTPTQLQVESYLNTNKIPQLFVASGCACWSEPSTYPWTFGWQPNYIIEGKVLGTFVASHFSGQSVGYLYQDDEFGTDGVKGLDDEISSADVVSRQPYSVAQLSAASGLGDQVAALQAAKAKVVVLYTIPAATAEALLAAEVLGYHPQWVISSVGSDITTLSGLLTVFSKGKGLTPEDLLNGVLTAGYTPAVTDSSNAWISLFKQIWQAYDATNKFDGNTLYGMAVGVTMVELLKAAGRNPTRQSLVTTLETDGAMLNTPGTVPLSYSSTDHYGYQGSEVFQIESDLLHSVSPVYVTQNTGAVTVFSGTLHSTAPSFTNPSF